MKMSSGGMKDTVGSRGRCQFMQNILFNFGGCGGIAHSGTQISQAFAVDEILFAGSTIYLSLGCACSSPPCLGHLQRLLFI